MSKKFLFSKITIYMTPFCIISGFSRSSNYTI
nr:MAG TPA: hypothetical protein [Bacteriophage sp.]